MLHLVLYSKGEPYTSTKQKLIDTINHFTNYKITIHNYDFERIKQTEWFDKIKDLPVVFREGRRDGYYNAWKAFIVHEVYDKMEENDLLYYVDSSRYFLNGFTENIDKLCEITVKEGIVAGSVGNDITNKKDRCCDRLDIWNKILPERDNSPLLDKMHVLNSWFMLVKNKENKGFVEDWVYWTGYKDDVFKDPLVTYHHTGDQSIFNILVHKYHFKVFYCSSILHNDNKDRNAALNILNKSEQIDQYFINL